MKYKISAPIGTHLKVLENIASNIAGEKLIVDYHAFGVYHDPDRPECFVWELVKFE